MKVSRLALAALLVAFHASTGSAAHVKPDGVAPPRAEHRNTVADSAQRGDAEAQYQMGQQALAKGKTPAAIRQALVWFTLSALNGRTAAAVDAAKLYEAEGNSAQAAHWWYRAGQLGDVSARARFMDLFQSGKTRGEVMGRDAAIWLAERAGSGHDAALKMALGDVFALGLGVPPNAVEAARWYQDAALDGNVDAMVRLGRIQLQRPAQWRAPDKAVDKDKNWGGPVLAPLRPQSRNSNGQLDLGRQAVAQDLDVPPEQLVFARPAMYDGEYWLNRARRQGLAPAMTALAQARLDGLSLPFDPVGAAWLLTSAACAGDGKASLHLAHYWADYNPGRAMAFAEIAARQGQAVPPETAEQLGKAVTPRQAGRAKQMAQDWCSGN